MTDVARRPQSGSRPLPGSGNVVYLSPRHQPRTARRVASPLRARLLDIVVLLALASGACSSVALTGPLAAKMKDEAFTQITHTTDQIFCAATVAGSTALCRH